MRPLFVVVLVFASLFLFSQLLADRTAQAQEMMRIAPASDGVELEEIRIVRQAALGAVKEADLTNMVLKLWFPATWKREEDLFHHLIHLKSLSAIEDDTGKLLLTEKRVRQINYLHGEVRGDEWRGSDRKGGPVARMLLEAPARRAEKIKAITGKAQISLAKAVRLTFNDLAAINGKELDHPDMKGLQALKLRFSIEEKDGRVSAKVTAPVNYAPPWRRGRLQQWDVVDGKMEIGLFSEGVSPDKEGVTVEKTYRRRSFKGLSLRLIVLDPVESKTFNFDFRNVELP
jgi:hypothetical protein